MVINLQTKSYRRLYTLPVELGATLFECDHVAFPILHPGSEGEGGLLGTEQRLYVPLGPKEPLRTPGILKRSEKVRAFERVLPS